MNAGTGTSLRGIHTEKLISPVPPGPEYVVRTRLRIAFPSQADSGARVSAKLRSDGRSTGLTPYSSVWRIRTSSGRRTFSHISGESIRSPRSLFRSSGTFCGTGATTNSAHTVSNADSASTPGSIVPVIRTDMAIVPFSL